MINKKIDYIVLIENYFSDGCHAARFTEEFDCDNFILGCGKCNKPIHFRHFSPWDGSPILSSHCSAGCSVHYKLLPPNIYNLDIYDSAKLPESSPFIDCVSSDYKTRSEYWDYVKNIKIKE